MSSVTSYCFLFTYVICHLPFQRFGFTNWYRSRPTYKRDYDCLQFNYGFGMWSDEDCSLNKPFLCQYMGE